jgi:replicative DNA helicase
VYDNISKNFKGTGALTGDPTGFRPLDKRSGGLQTSDLIIVAAETSQGKTSFAIKLAMNCGCPIAFYSMEMKKEQIAARMISISSGVPANEILYSKLDGGQIQQIDRGVAKVENLPVYFDDRSTSNIETILSSIRMMKIKYGIKGVVVDYLQILNVNMKGSNKEQQMGDVARRLKNIAKELDIWVIALSQLNRDAQNPVPSLARLRDSGQIAEAADMVILIYRPEVYGKRYPEEFSDKATIGTAMIDVAKGRNVGLMKFIVGFRKENTSFYDLEDVPTYEVKENRPDGLPF